MIRTCPAAVHVDGTARPQLIRREVNPGYYAILEEHQKLSGSPSMINTSFNMHEEPIVCSPRDAIRAFLDGRLDALAIGPYLVPNPARKYEVARFTPGLESVDSLGGLAVARHLHRQSLRILMYHGFDDAPSLERHCAHIRAHYQPVSLSQAVEWLRAGRPFSPNTLAVTVDDGYRNFQDVAYPVFKAYDIPSTIYVVSDFADQKLWLWIDQIHYAFEHSTRDEARIDRSPIPFQAGRLNRRAACRRSASSCQ
jgi:hypothetical protein